MNSRERWAWPDGEVTYNTDNTDFEIIDGDFYRRDGTLPPPTVAPPKAHCAPMSTNAAPFLLMCLCALTCTTFFLQYTIFSSIHKVSQRSVLAGLEVEADDDVLRLGRSGDINSVVLLDHQVDMDAAADAAVIPSNDNFYISVKDYVHRHRPVQHVEQLAKQQRYEPAAYKVAAELARRYNVKYIIDVGCGTAHHLAKLSREFNVIGIDYGINLERARTAFPHMAFIEADLDKDKGCSVALPEDTLYQSVVVAAEVMEHLVDPLYCLVRLLRHVSAYAAAVVVTSPDRRRLAKVFHWPRSLKGPPVNRHHVREWTLEELSSLFTDVNMHLVLSSYVCGRSKGCPTGFSSSDNPYVSQLLVLGNGNVQRIWEDTSLAVNIKVTAFVTLHPKTSRELLSKSLQHLRLQGVQVYLIQQATNVTLPPGLEVQSSTYTRSIEQTMSVIKSAIASKDFSYGDWFIVQDAHELLTVPTMLGAASNLTLRQFLQRVSYSPHCFNAVPATTVTMDSPGMAAGKNSSKVKLPFKIHSRVWWDDEEGRAAYPRKDTLQDRIRVWRKTYTGAKLFPSWTKKHGQVITDVHFLGRRAYPFHFLSMRFNPRNKKPVTSIPRKLSLMYGLDIGVGFTTATRKAIYQSKLPY